MGGTPAADDDAEAKAWAQISQTKMGMQSLDGDAAVKEKEGGGGGFVTGSTAHHMLRAWSCTIGPLCEIRRHISYAAATCYSLRACMRNSRTRVE